MTTPLPQGWTTATLGELLQFKYGKSLPERSRAGVGATVYGSNGVVGQHGSALVESEALIIGRKGSVGAVHHAKHPSWPIDTAYFVDELWGMSFRYWYYLLTSLDLRSLNRATAIPGLNRDDAYSVTIPIAPLSEQSRIADRLDALLARVDACRARLDLVPAYLTQLRQSVLMAATSGELIEDWQEPTVKNWKLVRLDEVASDFSYGSATKSARSGSVPVLRMGNIQDARLDWSDLVYTSDDAEIAKYQLTPGDVLFNRTNSPALVGKTAVYKGEQPAIYAGYLIRVRCGEFLLPDFLNYSLSSPKGRAYCWSVKSDGVSQSNINAKKLAAFSFALPSVAEQTEIVRRVESLFALADILESNYISARAQVEKLIPSMLNKAFRGELVTQDSADEPASELVKRISVMRANDQSTANITKLSRSEPLKSAPKDQLSDVIGRMPKEGFTFEELSKLVSWDYESLKEELFMLLADNQSGLKQFFDVGAKAMKFKQVYE